MSDILLNGNPGIMELFLRILISGVCGFMVGMERSLRLKEAGIRTHVIACCASALFMIVSKYGFADIIPGDLGARGVDSARIAAGVVSGISFLCAGVIIQGGGYVHGLTTAVGLWLTAAIGLALGAGMISLGLIGTAFTVAVQALLHRVTFGQESLYFSSMHVSVCSGFDFSELEKLIVSKTGGEIEGVSSVHNREGSIYEFILRTKKAVDTNDWNEIMEQQPGIWEISCKFMRKS